jgi:hypothetical protein
VKRGARQFQTIRAVIREGKKMPPKDIAKTVTTVFPWITAGVGWVVAIFQWRKKRKAETEVRLIRRRGDAPYLTPSSTTVNRLITNASAGEARTAATATVLTALNGEVPKDLPADTPVRLVVDNQGQPARRVSVSLEGKAIQLRSELALKFASGLQFLEYPYDPKKHGQDQTLIISFETASGVQDHHTYSLKHGIRHLVRTDPA